MYYEHGKKQTCPFCHTPTAKFVDGKRKPLPNLVHVNIDTLDGGKFRFNCCAQCAKKKDFKSPKILDFLAKSVLKCAKAHGINFKMPNFGYRWFSIEYQHTDHAALQAKKSFENFMRDLNAR